MHKNAQTVIDAEFRASNAIVQLARYSVYEPIECNLTQNDGFRLIYFSQRPPKAIARAVNRWKPDRFERLGDLFLIPEGEAIVTRGDVGEAVAICVQLDTELMRYWFNDKSEWTDHELRTCFNLQSSVLRELMMRFADEAANPGFASEVMVEAMSLQTAIELARHCQGRDEEPVRGGIQAWRLRLIEERLSDCAAPPTLAELARLCNLSIRQLGRSFKATCGASIGDYVTQKRIEHAKRLLKMDKSIKTIAHEMGFNSTSAFCFSFRKATGQTPGQHRAEMGRRDLARGRSKSMGPAAS